MQGCPLAMILESLGTVRLIRRLKAEHISTKSVNYADDLQVVAKIEEIGMFYDAVALEGPKIGYFPEPDKSVLIVREDKIADAKKYHDDNDRPF